MGGVRTALFNYLFAKKHGGDFLLRIEDTDQTRYVPGAEEYIIEALKWCNIPFDEGVGIGGNCGPYRQSERKPIYKKYADELIAKGWAYFAFDTPEELDAMRKKLEEEKSSTLQYDAITRKMMRNSLIISKEETEKLLNDGVQYVIRFKMPDNEELKMNDLIRGEVIVNTRTLDDKVLFKSDGMPTYHLANVVDDYLMDISHVIRGEEWLPSMPLHVMLYRAFGWTDKMPQFSHLPLLLKPDGKGKLSKRDGDRLGFPVFPLQWTSPEGEISSGYRESGYFADAFVNLLALLGWNSGTEQEIFTKEELVELFSLERVGKSGSKFDPEKAKWFNHQYLRTKSNLELAKLYLPILETKNVQVNEEFVVKVIALIKDRATFVKDFWEHSSFLFEAPTTYDETVIKKRWKEDVPDTLKKIIAIIILHSTDDIQKLHDKVMEFIQANELNMGQIMNCLRLSLVGGSKGPDLFEMIALLGEREVVTRIEKALETIKI
jgi:glutamyl-tRNA synthetase